MCDYNSITGTTDGSPVQSHFCPRQSMFWVQATVTTHNMHACTHHLARIVRDVESTSKAAIQRQKDGEKVPSSYFQWIVKDGKRYPRLFPREEHNWAYVTVKPYTHPRTRKAGN